MKELATIENGQLSENGVWDFGEAAEHALSDETLKIALLRATGKFDIGRQELMAQLPESELAREKARQIKDDVLTHLDTYLAQFVDAVEAAGGTVHWATIAEEANTIITEIARERDVKRIVKSKSMVSEETHLNKALLSEGFQVIETDLGEYILQIADDRPSHIVVPVVHKTKEQITELFNRTFNKELPPVPEELTAVARERLREEFCKADMGITGANFAAADTGTIVQVTNEGNGRLSTTWPPVHVVLMGIEKLIPRLADLPVFLKLLARSATGQPLTVYTNLITGPRGQDEGDGARELHVVLVDNGRIAALESRYREVLRCIRCGACLNTCPVYRTVGGHTYGGVYPGPIGSLLSPLYDGVRMFKDLPYASSLCGACYDVCPVKINIPQMLVEMRDDQVRAKMNTRAERAGFRFWAIGMKHPFLYRIGGKLMRYALWFWSCKGWTAKLPAPFGGWTDHRDFPLPASKSFRTRWRRLEKGKR